MRTSHFFISIAAGLKDHLCEILKALDSGKRKPWNLNYGEKLLVKGHPD